MPPTIGYATLAVLRAIPRTAGYGLDIMDATGLPSGTVYPTLSRLEKRGWVRARWENEAIARREGRPRRRYYRLTGAGEAAVRAAVREYSELLGGGAEESGDEAGTTPGPAPTPRPEEA
jgi:DNA-binding PadR family transcriptional regulator